MVRPTRVLIVDDSARVRNGLRALLATWPEIVVAGEATNGQEAVREVAACRPDAVLMDVHMPVLDGVQATKVIKQQWPAVTVIVLTMYEQEERAVLRAGADAFLIKSSMVEPLRAALGVDVVRE